MTVYVRYPKMQDNDNNTEFHAAQVIEIEKDFQQIKVYDFECDREVWVNINNCSEMCSIPDFINQQLV